MKCHHRQSVKTIKPNAERIYHFNKTRFLIEVCLCAATNDSKGAISTALHTAWIVLDTKRFTTYKSIDFPFKLFQMTKKL